MFPWASLGESPPLFPQVFLEPNVSQVGGPDLEEEELDGFSLMVSDEDVETECSSSEDEDGLGPPV